MSFSSNLLNYFRTYNLIFIQVSACILSHFRELKSCFICIFQQCFWGFLSIQNFGFVHAFQQYCFEIVFKKKEERFGFAHALFNLILSQTPSCIFRIMNLIILAHCMIGSLHLIALCIFSMDNPAGFQLPSTEPVRAWKPLANPFPIPNLVKNLL